MNIRTQLYGEKSHFYIWSDSKRAPASYAYELIVILFYCVYISLVHAV